MADAWYKENVSPDCDRRNDFVDGAMNIVFGSLHIESAIDMMEKFSIIGDVSAKDLAKVLYADRLIRNTDRTKINSNVLLSLCEGNRYYLIDHGNSFNDEYSFQDFLEQHIFSEQVRPLPYDVKYDIVTEISNLATNEVIDELWERMPEEWRCCPQSGYAISKDDIERTISFERRQNV